MFEEFKGKTAVVTGAGSGMGRACAIRLASLGAHVAVFARSAKGAEETIRLITEAGGSAAWFPCDVADEKQVEKAVADTVNTWGGLNFAFNAAGCGADGVHFPFAPLTEATESDFRQVVETNLIGTFHCLKYEILEMQKQGGGAIVNTASIGGLKMTPGFGAYGPSKAGVIALTQLAALENAKAGIRVNVICPGPTEGTNLMRDSVATGNQDTEFLKSTVIPMGQLGNTDEITDAVLFLLSDLSRHTTGQTLSVDGGMHIA